MRSFLWICSALLKKCINQNILFCTWSSADLTRGNIEVKIGPKLLPASLPSPNRY